MRISHRYKFIFFSNPKTGSETVREILNPYSDVLSVHYKKRTNNEPFYSHITPSEVKRIFQEKELPYDEYFKFTFVRNPWARLVSLYEMIYGTRKKKNVNNKYKVEFKVLYKKVFVKKPDFKTWLLTIHNNDIGAGGKEWERWRKYGSYSINNYIMDSEKNILVDKVIKLEDLQKELIPTLVNLGLPQVNSIKLPKINSGNHQKYTLYYDQESIDRVRYLYKYDIENFNYHFGE
jgi:hypothetical protein